MAKERICFACGTHYVWCNTCHDFDPTETWKYLYHDEDCLEISKIWRAYRGKEISKEEAKEEFKKYPGVMPMVMNYDSVLAKEVQEICKVANRNVVKQEEPQVENHVDIIEETQEVNETANKSSGSKNRNKKK